jgi:hypothetical protein
VPHRVPGLDAEDDLEAWLDALGHAWVGNGTYRDDPHANPAAPTRDQREAASGGDARGPVLIVQPMHRSPTSPTESA